jgi:sugar phosphate permease
MDVTPNSDSQTHSDNMPNDKSSLGCPRITSGFPLVFSSDAQSGPDKPKIKENTCIYLSLWYTPRDLATRGAIYFSTSSLAGAFSGLIAYGIVKDLSHGPPYKPWQWLFLVEGLISAVFGFLVLFALPPVPERLRWGFSAEEKIMAVVRTWQANNTPHATVNFRKLLVPFKWPILYVWIVLYACTQIAVTSLSSFLPTIVKGMGYESVEAQLMTVPVYACGFVSTIFFGWLSVKTQKRAIWIIVCSLGPLAGYIMLLIDTNHSKARYAGICIAAIGQYPLLPIINVWSAVNSRAYSERVTANTSIAIIGQAAASAALTGFDTPPYYIKGIWTVIGCICTMPLIAVFGWWYLLRENRIKIETRHDPTVNELRKSGLEELGSAHPDFM